MFVCTELYLARIMKDIELKAPQIAAQKRDYKRVLESHTQVTGKLDQLVEENSKLRKTVANVEQTLLAVSSEKGVLKQQNTDLGRQVLHLLGKGEECTGARIEEDGTGMDVVSEYLVVYNSVDDLQEKNKQLLTVVRKLAEDQKKDVGEMLQKNYTSHETIDEGTLLASEDNAPLEAVMKELHSLQESRKHTEEMVASLVHQRDMYRAMLEQSTSGSLSTTPSKTLSTPSKVVICTSCDAVLAIYLCLCSYTCEDLP